jgi:hypothetical protein
MPVPDVPPAIRPRYGRITAAVAATVASLVAVLGWSGVLPVSPAAADAARPSAAGAPAASASPASPEGAMSLTDGGYTQSPAAAPSAGPDDVSLPAVSGTGRRVVFDMSRQRVWLVGARTGADVRRTYLVSGSLTDNLRAGSYRVYSRSLHAVGVDDSGTMQYMVRFAHGANAAIGFHDIPVLRGTPVQSRADLGSPQSHGCIRQWRPDAQALWAFAPVGTRVVVVA